MDIITAFSKIEVSNQFSDLLEGNGLYVHKKCTSIADIRGSISYLDKVLVITQYRFKDGSVEKLLMSKNKNTTVVIVSNDAPRDLIEFENVFVVRIPINQKFILNIVNMNVQLYSSKAREQVDYSGNEFIIKRAKEILQHDYFFYESEAHRFIQKKSMDLSLKAIETAKIIIDTYI